MTPSALVLAADWLLAYWSHGIVLGTAIGLVARVARRPATRVRLWRLALVAPFATATLAVATGTHAMSLTSVLRPHVPVRWAERDVSVSEIRDAGGAPRRRVAVRDPLERGAALTVCLAALAAALAGGLALLHRRRPSRRVLATRTTVARDGGITLSEAPGLLSPVALVGCEICVPTGARAALGAEAWHAVLLHERAHLERRDPAWHGAARTIAAVAWWQPTHRAVLRALVRDAELAADDAAVARGADPRALVAALAHFAERIDGEGLALGAALGAALGDTLADGGSPLVSRARRLLDDAPRGRGAPSLVVGLATALALAAPLLVPRPSAADGNGSRPRAGRRIAVDREVRVLTVRAP